MNVAITGGARGIGLATAKAFVAQGARVYIGDIDEAAAQGAAAEIGATGLGVDVRSRESFAAFLAAVDGPLEVLVNNAGIMPMGRFADEDDLITDAIFDINVKGVLTGTKLALPGMLERGGGHIVNVASYLGEVPAAGLASYCASKHTVIGFTESLRDELHGTGVTVTAVLPSAVRTDLVAGVQLGGVLPTVDPERIANAVVASCRHRRTLVAVPGWMRGYEFAAAVLPDRLLAAVRGRLTRDRVLHRLDTAARAAYDSRVRRASADH
ncbi:SDR family oxidoreductase [Nocardia yamanashiensis]|uniref:SDR family oxidoreductase n=1 Tax=Nocardia yamanashiensis TaxID=209247 RepID=UPI001E3F7F8C|nr:SDR family oxidoreductase [Nocardia yamanashiensis]UGT38746.1 SDR family oxidoreductase [Nocardia yamanashiensis]